MRREKGEIKKLILRLGEWPMSLAQICKKIEMKTDRPVKKQQVSRDLRDLKKDGRFERVIINSKVMWRPVESYVRGQERETICSIVQEPAPVSFSFFSFPPFFQLGALPPASEAVEVAADELAFQCFLPKVMMNLEHMRVKGRNIILGFAARCLWLGYISLQSKLLREEGPAENLENLIAAGMEGKYRRFYLADYMAAGYDLCVGKEPLPYHGFLLLTRSLVASFEKWPPRGIPRGKKKNVTWLKTHKGEFKKFVKDVKKIRFASCVTVGFEHVQKLRELVPVKAFESWRKDLRNGRFDYPWMVRKLREIRLAAANMAWCLERGAKPKEGPRDPELGWSFHDLYLRYPRGRDSEFYSEIESEVKTHLETIEGARS